MVPLRLVEHLWMEPAADGLTALRPAPLLSLVLPSLIFFEGTSTGVQIPVS